MWEQIVKYFKSNMDTISKAKGPFILIGIIGLGLGAYLNGIRYDGIIENKDSVIDTKIAIIEQLKGRHETIKTLIFDDTGKFLMGVGVKEIIESLSTEKKTNNIIVLKLKTKKYLPYIPTIESITPFYYISWIEIERLDGNIISWIGRFRMHGDELEPQFKMEIYDK